MIEYGDEPKRLVSTLLTYRNDIDIYTEDELKDKEFYKVLLSRLVEDKVKITDITPLGSKKNVIERCMNEPDNGRKKLFIVDGDIVLIHGKGIPKIRHLFVLDAYCMENLLLNKESIIHFIYFNCASKSIKEIEKEVEFENWLNTYSNKFIDLFIHFAILDFFGGRFTLYNAQKFHKLEKKTLIFSEDLVNNYIDILKTDILKLVKVQDYETKYEELKKIWSVNINNLLTIVSGKDYLIPTLLYKTQSFKKSKALPTYEEVKFFLAHHCNLSRLSDLKSVIESL